MPATHAAATRVAPAQPRPAAHYKRREPEQTPLYAIIHEHLESFLALAARADPDGALGLPRFVVKELRAFLSCGILAKGFARFRCTACGKERLVAYSCKGRGFCPSCGGKRMTQLAAHLVDHVIPVVPTRQYVLSLPWQLRARLAYEHAHQKEVVRIYTRELLRFHEARAKEQGITNAQTGTVTFIQRFGSSLNLNLHLHTQVMDGVFTERPDGTVDFHALRPPSKSDLRLLTSCIRLAVLEYAVKHDLLLDDTPPDADASALATLMGASAKNLRALGPAAGVPVQRLLGVDPESLHRKEGRFSVHYDGFDLHAGLTVRATRREVLERVLRYCLRPAISHQRVERLPDGRVRLTLKTPWRDGTSHLVFEPLEFIGRLVALIPRPHKNLVVYHGVLAPRSKWRERVTAYRRSAKRDKPPQPKRAQHTAASDDVSDDAAQHPPRHHNYAWAVVMRRAFVLDVLECPHCAGRLQLITCVTSPVAARAILRHLALPADHPTPSPARAPPWAAAAVDPSSDRDLFDAIDDPSAQDDRFDAVDDEPDSAA